MSATTTAAPNSAARAYARALLELAKKQGGHELIETLQSNLEAILELTVSDKGFGEFLSSRIISPQRRAKSLKAIFEKNAHPLTLRLLLLLNRKGRLGFFSQIVAAFDALAQEQIGRVEVNVYTAEPLNQANLQLISQRLAAALGKQTIVHPYVQPGMIGGIKLQIGDRLLDASLATQLRRLGDRLGQEGSAKLRSRLDDILD